MNKTFSIIVILFLCSNSFSQYGSKERIYDGFTLVNESLEATKMMLEQKGDQLYYDLTLSYQENGDSAILQFEHGMALREKADHLVLHINNLKVFLIAKTEGLTKPEVLANDTIISLRNIENFDDYQEPTKWLIGDSKHNPKEGQFTARELEEKLLEFQKSVDSLILKTDLDDGVKLGFLSQARNRNYGNWWIRDSFYEKPLSAVITYLSKLQIDIKLTEQDAIRYLTRK